MGTTSLAIPDSKKFESTLSKLKQEAAAIVVNSPEACLEAKTMQRSVRNYIKDAKSALDPFVNMTKRAYDDARDERARWIDPAEMIDDGLSAKVKDFERKEREKAAREEEERNREKRAREAREAEQLRKEQEAQAKRDREAREKEIAEARKAGDLKAAEAKKLQKEAEERERQAKEQAARDAAATKANFVPDKVLSNIPTVQGVPSRINYKAEVTHPERLINAYLDAVSLRNTERAVYLRRFIMVNEQALGLEARTVKNSKKLEAEIPGVRFYED
jgi:hypothetical protein